MGDVILMLYGGAMGLGVAIGLCVIVRGLCLAMPRCVADSQNGSRADVTRNGEA